MTPHYPFPTISGEVRVYWNSRKKLWSVVQNGRVAAHLPSIRLHECRFTVQPGGRARVLKTGRKNVHAWVTGTVDDFPERPVIGKERVRYNPYREETFVGEAGRRVSHAFKVDFQPNGTVWAALAC